MTPVLRYRVTYQFALDAVEHLALCAVHVWVLHPIQLPRLPRLDHVSVVGKERHSHYPGAEARRQVQLHH